MHQMPLCGFQVRSNHSRPLCLVKHGSARRHSLPSTYQYSGCWLSVQVDSEAAGFIVGAGMVQASSGPHLRVPHGIFGTVTTALGSMGTAGGFVTTSVCNLRKRLRAAHNHGYAWYLTGRPPVREVFGKVFNEFL
jgi:hypothetical protein